MRKGKKKYRIDKKCKFCGKLFSILISCLKRKGCGQFCSKQCYWSCCRGEKSHRWKGGKSKDSFGYIIISCKGHPHASVKGDYVSKHRLVMEKHLGRYLNPKEIVHHINGDKTDNRLKNLLLVSRKEHNLIHHLGKKHIKRSDRNE